MSVKTTGSELKRFYATDLDSDQWFEEEEITVNGKEFEQGGDIEAIPDGAIVTLSGGFVANDPKERTVEGLFKAWRKRQSIKTLIIEFDKAKEDDVRRSLKAAGAKIVKAAGSKS